MNVYIYTHTYTYTHSLALSTLPLAFLMLVTLLLPFLMRTHILVATAREFVVELGTVECAEAAGVAGRIGAMAPVCVLCVLCVCVCVVCVLCVCVRGCVCEAEFRTVVVCAEAAGVAGRIGAMAPVCVACVRIHI